MSSIRDRMAAAEPIARLAKQISQFHNIDPDLTCAIIDVESNWDPWAARYEPGWRYFSFFREHASRLRITAETEQVFQATSWGNCQIMGAVARELGYTGPLQQLALPELGIQFGVLKLKELRLKYHEEAEVVCAYNTGSAAKEPSGFYRGQKYLDKVHARLHQLRSLNDPNEG